MHRFNYFLTGYCFIEIKRNLTGLAICRFQLFSENMVWPQSQKALTQLLQLGWLSLETWPTTPSMPWLVTLSIAPSGYSPFISVILSFTPSAIRYLISLLVDCSGSGASMDVVVSSVRAYLTALNKMCSFAGAVKASCEVSENTRVKSKEWDRRHPILIWAERCKSSWTVTVHSDFSFQ